MSPELLGQEGGEQRLAAFLRAHWTPLGRYVVRRVGDRHVAEDVRQTVAVAFMLKWRADGGIDDAEAVLLLYGIAEHKINDRFRATYRERRVFFSHVFGEDGAAGEKVRREVADPAGENPFVAVLREVDLAAVGITLTHRQQQVLQLHYLDGFALAQVAQIVGISVSAVQKHLDAARKRLVRARAVYDMSSIVKNTKEAR